MNKLLFILVFSLFIASGKAQSLVKNEPSFVASQQRFLDGLEQKNIGILMESVDDTLTTIFPDGEIMHTKEKFRAFNEAWFKKDWKITTEAVNNEEKNDLAYSLIKYKYVRFNPDKSEKSASHIFLLLIYKKVNNQWILVHNQHTKILL